MRSVVRSGVFVAGAIATVACGGGRNMGTWRSSDGDGSAGDDGASHGARGGSGMGGSANAGTQGTGGVGVSVGVGGNSTGGRSTNDGGSGGSIATGGRATGGQANTGGARATGGSSASTDGGSIPNDGGPAPSDAFTPSDACTNSTCNRVCSTAADCPGESEQCVANECRPGKLVFLSSFVLTADFGGIVAGDALCNTMANHAGLRGSYRAWLSDHSSSPATRFARSTVPYRLVDGSQIAADWNDLTDGQIDAPIGITEFGTPPDVHVGGECHGPPTCITTFTNTSETGEAMVGDPGDACSDWTSAHGLDHYVSFGGGDRTMTDSYWSVFALGFRCDAAARIYCFQQ